MVRGVKGASPEPFVAVLAVPDSKHDVVVLGELRGNRRPERPGPAVVAAFVAGKAEQRMIFGAKVEVAPASDPERVAVFDALLRRLIHSQTSKRRK